MTIYCDNEKALSVARDWSKDRMTPNYKNADLLSLSLQARDRSSLQFYYEHVRENNYLHETYTCSRLLL